MNINDLLLIRAVASSPNDAMRTILSPKIGYEEEWIESDSVRKIFRYMAKTILRGDEVSAQLVFANVTMPEEDRVAVVAAWKDGKQNPVSLLPVIDTVKSDYIVRSGETVIAEYRKKVAEDRSRVKEYLASLGLNISMLSRGGITYDPTPSSHAEDVDMKKNGNWGDSTLDAMFSEGGKDLGGKPSYGLIIASCPTGSGKTTMAVTLLAHAVAYGNDPVVAMSNEAPRSRYSRGVFRALKALYAGEEYEDSIWRKINEKLTVYGPGNVEDDEGNIRQVGMPISRFEDMQQIIFWDKPKFAVMDSINDVDFPGRFKDDVAMHAAKSSAFRNLCMDSGLLMYAPGNMSSEMQVQLRQKPEDAQSVKLFRSQSYENAADYSFLGWQDVAVPGRQNWKRCKNRTGTSKYEVFSMMFDYNAGIYRMSA